MHQDSNTNVILDRQDTDLQRNNQTCDDKKQKVYFMSFICTPNLLQNPTESKQRFSTDLWSDKSIKSIKLMAHYVQIIVNHKKKMINPSQSNLKNKQLTQQIHLSDNDYQKQLKSIKNNFTIDYPLLKKKFQTKPKSYFQQQFESWLKGMRGKNFAAWFLPFREDGPKLRKLIISRETLKILGYQPEQFHFEFEKYSDLAIQLLNGCAYKTGFMSYLTSFRKFMSMELRGDISLQDCVNESQRVILNEMKGKNNKSVKVQMKWYMPNVFTVCNQVIKIIEHSQFKDHQHNQYKKSVASRIEKKAYHSLSRITRLPQDMNPKNKHRICSYQIIRQPEYTIEETVKQQDIEKN